MVGRCLGTESKKLPPGAIEAAGWLGASVAFGLVKPPARLSKGDGFGGCCAAGDAKLKELNASFIPPNAED